MALLLLCQEDSSYFRGEHNMGLKEFITSVGMGYTYPSQGSPFDITRLTFWMGE